MSLLVTLSWWWWPFSPWLSPAAAWFIFVNTVIGAIAVMSTTTTSGATLPHRRRLCRSGSSPMVLDRLRSFFVFPVGQLLPIDVDDDHSSAAALGSHCYHCSSREAEAAFAIQVPAAERNNPELVTAAAPAPTGGTAAAISDAQRNTIVAMATVEDHAPPPPAPEEDRAEVEAEKEQDHDESNISLDEAYALAQRHRAKPPVALPPPATTTAAAPAESPPPTEHKTKKVAADWQRVSKAAEALEGKAELNARAELFIRQFREDLRLQRLNSILRHTRALGGSPTPTAAR